VISLADYDVEKTLVLAVPHRVLIGVPEELETEAEPEKPKSARRKRRHGDIPF